MRKVSRLRPTPRGTLADAARSVRAVVRRVAGDHAVRVVLADRDVARARGAHAGGTQSLRVELGGAATRPALRVERAARAIVVRAFELALLAFAGVALDLARAAAVVGDGAHGGGVAAARVRIARIEVVAVRARFAGVRRGVDVGFGVRNVARVHGRGVGLGDVRVRRRVREIDEERAPRDRGY